MTGFKPRTSGIGSDRSTNWATTTAHFTIVIFFEKSFQVYYSASDVEPLHYIYNMTSSLIEKDFRPLFNVSFFC